MARTADAETMFNGNGNGRFLTWLITGLVIALTLVVGSLGHAVLHSQAFF
jgi:hypothetical protein